MSYYDRDDDKNFGLGFIPPTGMKPNFSTSSADDSESNEAMEKEARQIRAATMEAFRAARDPAAFEPVVMEPEMLLKESDSTMQPLVKPPATILPSRVHIGNRAGPDCITTTKSTNCLSGNPKQAGLTLFRNWCQIAGGHPFGVNPTKAGQGSMSCKHKDGAYDFFKVGGKYFAVRRKTKVGQQIPFVVPSTEQETKRPPRLNTETGSSARTEEPALLPGSLPPPSAPSLPGSPGTGSRWPIQKMSLDEFKAKVFESIHKHNKTCDAAFFQGMSLSFGLYQKSHGGREPIYLSVGDDFVLWQKGVAVKLKGKALDLLTADLRKGAFHYLGPKCIEKTAGGDPTRDLTPGIQPQPGQQQEDCPPGFRAGRGGCMKIPTAAQSRPHERPRPHNPLIQPTEPLRPLLPPTLPEDVPGGEANLPPIPVEDHEVSPGQPVGPIKCKACIKGRPASGCGGPCPCNCKGKPIAPGVPPSPVKPDVTAKVVKNYKGCVVAGGKKSIAATPGGYRGGLHTCTYQGKTYQGQYVTSPKPYVLPDTKPPKITPVLAPDKQKKKKKDGTSEKKKKKANIPLIIGAAVGVAFLAKKFL